MNESLKQASIIGAAAFFSGMISLGFEIVAFLINTDPPLIGLGAACGFIAGWEYFLRDLKIAKGVVSYISGDYTLGILLICSAIIAFVLGYILAPDTEFSLTEKLMVPLFFCCVTIFPAAGIHCLLIRLVKDHRESKALLERGNALSE